MVARLRLTWRRRCRTSLLFLACLLGLLAWASSTSALASSGGATSLASFPLTVPDPTETPSPSPTPSETPTPEATPSPAPTTTVTETATPSPAPTVTETAQPTPRGMEDPLTGPEFVVLLALALIVGLLASIFVLLLAGGGHD